MHWIHVSCYPMEKYQQNILGIERIAIYLVDNFIHPSNNPGLNCIVDLSLSIGTVFNNANQHINVYGDDIEVDYRGYEVQYIRQKVLVM